MFRFCFSKVRATNLQELVYKNGQAGITKATVSVAFDNTDKKQSPLGYEQYDEITITRQVCWLQAPWLGYMYMKHVTFYCAILNEIIGVIIIIMALVIIFMILCHMLGAKQFSRYPVL